MEHYRPDHLQNNITQEFMENLKMEPTSLTPYVYLNAEKGFLNLVGRSSPDNSLSFYSKIQSYLEDYFKQCSLDTFKLNVNLEYFNTSSLKCIFQILKKLSDVNSQGEVTVEINWYYEEDDDDMLETGEDISGLLNISFNFIAAEVGSSALMINETAN